MPAFEETKGVGGIYFAFRYDENILKLIKSIPWEGRRWEPGIKSWWVADDYVPYARYVLRDNGKDDYGDWFFDQRVENSSARRAQNSPYHELATLIQEGSDDLVRDVFRRLLHHYHPDVGGEHKQMVRLNHVWEQIKALRGIK